MRYLRADTVAAVWWALRAKRAAHRLIDARELRDGVVPGPPRLPGETRWAVASVLSRTGSTCLIRALVLQAWDAAHGERRDVVIGVRSDETFEAHAWLHGEPLDLAEDYVELMRRPAPQPSGGVTVPATAR